MALMPFIFKFPSRRKKEAGRATKAYSLIDLLVGLAFLMVLGAIILPSLARPHACRYRINCTNNLKQTGLSFKQWALDNQDRYPAQVPVTNGGTMEFVGSGVAWVHFMVMSNELNTPQVVFCPEEKNPNRKCATSFAATAPPGSGIVPFTSDTNTSYFVGVDATDVFPGMWLAGDANFKIGKVPLGPGLISLHTNTPIAWNDARHEGKGNLCFADGSVQQLANATLIPSLRSLENLTNRLAMP
jgi:prepilin-type processing-associated H-X9-DG protein